jgi:FkbH-like protein
MATNSAEDGLAAVSQGHAAGTLHGTEAAPARLIKCVVWDLDNTVWDGVLVEGGGQRLRAHVRECIQTLDARGILQSIASRNDHAHALAQLEFHGLAEYFLEPQIGWGSKAASIDVIAKRLNLGVEAFAFIDDQPFEREEVQFSLPQVLCLDPAHMDGLLQHPSLSPAAITGDARTRRQMYRADAARQRAEESFRGAKEEFLATLGMTFRIERASAGDLERAHELTVRTHQLNATGYSYSYEELDRFRQSPKHLLLMASLEDRFGSYGRIGLALVECGDRAWTLKLMLMSCRVMSRGVGTVLLHYLMAAARRAGRRLEAEFVSTDRNRIMYVTYKFAGFRECARREDVVIFEDGLGELPAIPPWMVVATPETPDRVAA